MKTTGRALGEVRRSGSFSSSLFSLGVASGDPTPDGFVLWTRLAPDPLNGEGMPDENQVVSWEVAADDRFTRVVRSGMETAVPLNGHSVHVDVEGLDSNRWYWYRFMAAGDESRVGRTRTLPSA